MYLLEPFALLLLAGCSAAPIPKGGGGGGRAGSVSGGFRGGSSFGSKPSSGSFSGSRPVSSGNKGTSSWSSPSSGSKGSSGSLHGGVWPFGTSHNGYYEPFIPSPKHISHHGSSTSSPGYSDDYEPLNSYTSLDPDHVVGVDDMVHCEYDSDDAIYFTAPGFSVIIAPENMTDFGLNTTTFARLANQFDSNNTAAAIVFNTTIGVESQWHITYTKRLARRFVQELNATIVPGPPGSECAWFPLDEVSKDAVHRGEIIWHNPINQWLYNNTSLWKHGQRIPYAFGAPTPELEARIGHILRTTYPAVEIGTIIAVCVGFIIFGVLLCALCPACLKARKARTVTNSTLGVY